MFYDERNERGRYKTAQLCQNGHTITDDVEGFPESASNFCARCGTATLTKCPDCQTPIRGYHDLPGVISVSEYIPPRHCHNCGKPMPWTKAAVDLAQEFASEIDELSAVEKATLKEAIADLTIEGPKAEVAQARYRKLLSKVAPTMKATLDKIIVTVVTEATKKYLGL